MIFGYTLVKKERLIDLEAVEMIHESDRQIIRNIRSQLSDMRAQRDALQAKVDRMTGGLRQNRAKSGS